MMESLEMMHDHLVYPFRDIVRKSCCRKVSLMPGCAPILGS